MPTYDLETARGRKLTIEAQNPQDAMDLADKWDMQDHATSEATRLGVNPDLILRQMQQESGGNPNAVSPKGARGPMQLMPATAKGLGVNPDDPYENITGGVTYLKQQLDAFGGDEAKALAAYNAGPGAVRKAGGVPNYPETQAYVKALAGKSPTAAPAPAPQAAKPTSMMLGLLEGILPAAEKLAPYSPANLIPGFRERNESSLAALNARVAERGKTESPSKTGEFLGNMATTGWFPGGPMINGALTGGALSKGKNSAEVLRDAAYGAAGGKIGASLMGGAGKLLTGLTGDALKLANKGVPLTPGQMAGGALRRVEDSLTSVPVVGDAIRNAQRRGLEGVNRAAYNDTLAHIGEKLPAEINVGRDAYNYTRQTLSDAYDAVLSPLTLTKDAPWTAAVGGAKSAANKLGDKSIRASVNDIIKTEVLSRFDKAGQMTGENMKAAQEALTGHINDLSKGTKWSRDAAGVLRGLKGDLEGLVGRVDPAAGANLAKVNKAYSFLKPLENAAAKPSSKDGIFTIPQLAMGAAAGKSKATLAAGKAPHQDLADASRLLPSTVPDSGSAGRLFTGGGATALLGLLGGHLPVLGPAAAPAAGLIGGGAALYSRLGQEALTALLSRRPEVARVSGKYLQRLAPPAGTALAVGASSGARQ